MTNEKFYAVEKENFIFDGYRWNGIMVTANNKFRLTVDFGRKGTFIRVSEWTVSGWVVVCDEWCLDIKNMRYENPFNLRDEYKTYTRLKYEMAMLQFIADVYDLGVFISSRVQEIDEALCKMDSAPEIKEIEQAPPRGRVVTQEEIDRFTEMRENAQTYF